jgi:cell division protein FtsX
MFPFIWRSLRGRGIRSLLLLFGVLVVSGAFGLLTSAAETVQVIVDEDLAKYWRTTYDILVRPPGTRSTIEEKYGLVQANHLSGIPGGITFEQYEAISSIPGVEVAAPIAMLSYFDMHISFGFERQASRIEEPGVYRVDVTLAVDDGLRQHEVTLHRYLFLASQSIPLSWEERADLSARRLTVISLEELDETTRLVAPLSYGLPILLAAIDPEQEAALVGLDGAVTERSYFRASDVPRGDTHPFPDIGGMIHNYHVPILLNGHSYVQAEVRGDVWRVTLPADGDTFQEVLARGEAQYLETLPAERAGTVEYSNAEIYQWLPHWGSVFLFPWTASVSLRSASFAPLPYVALPATPEYVEIQAPWAISAPVLEARPQGMIEAPGSGVTRTPEVCFRAVTRRLLEGVQEEDQVQIEGEIVGGFDIEELPPLAEELVYVPLETYYPPLVTLRYDEGGTPVEPPVEIHPTLNPEGYIQHPPLLLTTLEAAKLFNSVDPISAVRVRVGDTDRYSPEAQAQIEAIAAEIVARTSLQVDVVVGSSPRRVLVHIPGYEDIPPLGYVEELWIQKGVNLIIGRQIKQGNLVLFGVMLVSCSLYILNTSLMSVLGRRREVALQKALGWRSSTVFRSLLIEAALVGLVAGVLGLLLALGIAALLRLRLPLANAALILPTGLGLCLLGTAIPALLAARTPPAPLLQRGEVTGGALPGSRPGLGTYVLRGLWRRRARLGLALAAMAVAAGLVTLFGMATLGTRGYLSGTLLGEYLLLHIKGYHYGMAAVVLGVAALAVADALIEEVLTRRQEIGVLKAVGWRDRQVAGLFVQEGLLLGLGGGVLGWLVGLTAYGLLYRGLPAQAWWVTLPALGVPVLVGAVAAWYPARQAARVPPAEAVRYE